MIYKKATINHNCTLFIKIHVQFTIYCNYVTTEYIVIVKGVGDQYEWVANANPEGLHSNANGPNLK